jgi:hypothetical protein
LLHHPVSRSLLDVYDELHSYGRTSHVPTIRDNGHEVVRLSKHDRSMLVSFGRKLMLQNASLEDGEIRSWLTSDLLDQLDQIVARNWSCGSFVKTAFTAASAEELPPKPLCSTPAIVRHIAQSRRILRDLQKDHLDHCLILLPWKSQFAAGHEVRVFVHQRRVVAMCPRYPSQKTQRQHAHNSSDHDEKAADTLARTQSNDKPAETLTRTQSNNDSATAPTAPTSASATASEIAPAQSNDQDSVVHSLCDRDAVRGVAAFVESDVVAHWPFSDVVVDVWIDPIGRENTHVVDINPGGAWSTSDGVFFNWLHDRHILSPADASLSPVTVRVDV